MWKKGSIAGVEIQMLNKHLDERGFLVETFRLDELPKNIRPSMSYISYTEPGKTRGPHEHIIQTDIFTFIGPGNFLVKLWDNRKESETYRNYVEIYIGMDRPATVIVPPGVVHGYKNISVERGMVINYPTELYRGWGKTESVDEIRYEDQTESAFTME